MSSDNLHSSASLGVSQIAMKTEWFFYEPKDNTIWFDRQENHHDGEVSEFFLKAVTRFFLNFGTYYTKSDETFTLLLASLFNAEGSLPETFKSLLCDESEIRPEERWEVESDTVRKETEEEVSSIPEPAPKRTKRDSTVSLIQLADSDKKDTRAVANVTQVSMKTFGDDDKEEDEVGEKEDEESANTATATAAAAATTTMTNRQDKPQVMPGINTLSQEDAREVGKWGEELAFVLLKKEYSNGLLITHAAVHDSPPHFHPPSSCDECVKQTMSRGSTKTRKQELHMI